MSLIKICGLRTPADIAAAGRLRPDYVGFVFAPSKRRISRVQAAHLRALLPPEIPAVGVFVNETVETVVCLVREGTINLVQLHGDEDAAYRAALRRQLSCPIIQAVPVGETLPPCLPEDADYLLFDTAGAQRGGSGQSFDWSLLREVKQQFFLAGGLNEHNIMQARETARPFCLDVSSGAETGGAKDPEKMKNVIALVRR